MKSIDNLIDIVLTADRYSLGSHWVYKDEELEDIGRYDKLIEPKSMWHKGKVKGELSHIGDELLFFNNYIKKEGTFNRAKYTKEWVSYINNYKHHIDNSARLAMDVLDKKAPKADSNDGASACKILPLLLIADSKEEFLKLSSEYSTIAYDGEDNKKLISFYAGLIYDLLHEISLSEAVKNNLNDNEAIANLVQKANDSLNLDTVTAISTFGKACESFETFTGAYYLLLKYKGNIKEALIENAFSGGDTVSRATIYVSIAFLAYDIAKSDSEWLSSLKV